MPSIQGFTPDMLWTTMIVIIGICAVLATVYKVIEIFRKEKDFRAHQIRESAGTDNVAQEVTRQVVRDLEPRFEAIEREIEKVREKLNVDKTRLDVQSESIHSVMISQRDIGEGFSAMCMALIAVLNHELHNGNADEMQKAADDLHIYLVRQAGKMGNKGT